MARDRSHCRSAGVSLPDVVLPLGGGRRININTEAPKVLWHRPDLSLSQGRGWSHTEVGGGGGLGWNGVSEADQRNPHHGERQSTGKVERPRHLQT